MPTITINVRGLAGAIQSIQRLSRWKRGLVGPLGTLLKHQHEQRIINGKAGPDGRPWEPLRPATIAKKERNGNPNPDDILIDTRAMLGSFQVTASGDVIRLRNPSRQMVWLQDGTPHMVARPVMGMSRPNVTEIKRLVTRHVASLLRGRNG